ncbi:type II toxin-antitoxin system Phd/YefM family antitoxin [Deinococcus pimensis]|uniref:type II toxin-antitoxin system Phd/YefM family antitoxin n=1 Tax=Deinococcus pimensis TaxID=309888 RepID=UPI0004BCCA6D|nr:type II toxin-antitoxin system prevent-host-death family antitoxin [Deinococcus pimensis]
MTVVNMLEAKTQLSKYVDAAQRGEVVIIARAGVPAAKLVALAYRGNDEWSPAMRRFFEKPHVYDPDGFSVPRDDLASLTDRELF